MMLLSPMLESPTALRIREFLRIREVGIALAVLLLVVLWTVSTDTFMSANNLLNVARNISIIALLGVGMTYLLIAGELDLSIGSAYGFLAVVLAVSITDFGLSPGLATLVAIAGGALLGLINGLITTGLKVPSFIVTLGMLSVLRGGALVVSNGLPISIGTDAPLYKSLTSGYLFGIVPAQVLWMIAGLLVGGIVLSKTRFGAHVYAVGGNADGAGKAGIPVARVKIACFALTGMMAGVAASILVGWFGNANPLTGQGDELAVIAAVVVGGTSLFGGAGSILGTFLGAALVGLLTNGLVLLGVGRFWQQIATGVIIIAAVIINATVHARVNRR